MQNSIEPIIIVSEKGDYMTFLVCEWLHSYGHPFKRHDAGNKTDITYSLSNKKDASTGTTLTWIRKGRKLLFNNNQRGSSCYDFYIREQKKVLEYEELKAKTIGSYIKEVHHNKLLTLSKAVDAGFKIPHTLVTTEKRAVVDFLELHGRIITKEISNLMKVTVGNTIFNGAGTFEVVRNTIQILNDTFDISLFQQLIISVFEVRVFVFLDSIFAMAIFKHRDDKKIDSRHNDANKNPRYVPYALPTNVQKKIKNLCSMMGINTGSFDFLVDEKLDYYFLEVNIQGEFHWTSEYCNYSIDKQIAESLTNLKSSYGRV